jgi:hydrogenase expression/formation protein HypE
MAVMSRREGLHLSLPVASDCAPLSHLVSSMLSISKNIHSLRDPTRGGLAATLNEFARQSDVGIIIEEDKIPVHDGVRGACELLGLDPLYIANEGKLVAAVVEADAGMVLAAMQKNKYARQAAVIGEVTGEHRGRVVMKTGIGSSRIVDMPVGEILPRIC